MMIRKRGFQKHELLRLSQNIILDETGLPLDLLNHVFDELAELNSDITHKDYSKIYLGRCGSYYSYLKSTGKQPSTDVLLHLWNKLNAQQNKFRLCASYAQNDREQQFFSDWIAVYQKLGDDVLSVLKERGCS